MSKIRHRNMIVAQSFPRSLVKARVNTFFIVMWNVISRSLYILSTKP
jgi:hypothetical protein